MNDEQTNEATNEAAQEEARGPLPPASFAFLVLSLRAQAEMQLGLMRFGEEDKEGPDLQMARHSIDLMGMLLEKTKGNLELDERRLLENSLTELRFRFVQASDDAAKAAAQKS
jgi:hypothetical protein